MTPRGMILSVAGLAVLAVAGIGIIAAAFQGGNEDESRTQVVAPSPMSTAAPTIAIPSPEAQSTKAPTPTTIGAGPKPTFTPTVPATPTPKEPTPEPGGGGPPDSSPTKSPGQQLPDLVVLDLVVTGGRISAVIGNVGGQAVPSGTTVQLVLRGALAGSSTLTQSLAPGGNFTLLLPQEFVSGPESVTALVDPNNLIPEANEANNGLTRHLEPDVMLDLAVTALSAVGGDEHLSVTVRNNSSVSARGVEARLTVYRSGSTSPLSVTVHQLNVEPQGTVTLEPGVAAARGLSLRVVLELIGVADGDPSNNVLEWLIP
jgi:subtilase family serine protease